MEKIVVLKKNNATMSYDFQKIVNAIQKAAARAVVVINAEDLETFRARVENELLKAEQPVPVQRIHSIVEKNLDIISPEVARSYREYRNYKQDFSSSWEEIYTKSRDALYLGDRENANFDSALNSTKGSLIRGYLTKELYKKFEMKADEIQAIEDGYLYIHDLNNLLFRQINCCLFDMKTLLKNGFHMANNEYREPKSVLSANQVIGDVALSATAQQFGGWTVPEIDKVLVPYAIKTRERLYKEAGDYGIANAASYVRDRLWEELVQGFQSIEMKLNTVPCSRGDFAFTTLTFGNMKDSEDLEIQQLICKAILHVRQHGQGKHHRPVVFPKLVYLYSEEQHNTLPGMAELFDQAVSCSAKAMYPDYLAIDTVGEVSRIFKTHGVVTSPMGCRAYLSEWIDPDTQQAVTTGRANIGAVSLNLPMIWMKAKEENQDFYRVITHYLNIARGFLNRRYEYLSKAPASTNPLAFTQGGLYQGFLKPEEPIGDLVRSFTASFGITALHELCVLMTGKALHETDGSAVEAVVDYINDYIITAKAEDNRLFALYGTPAESLCGTQLQQFRSKYGIIPGVSDRQYFTNSFHMHVSADITPFEKQDLEQRLFHKVNGGHIVYNRIRGRYNKEAIKTVVLRGMRLGLYQGINYDLNMCDTCGWDGEESVDACPECGSKHISAIGRVCGYLGFSKTNGSSRFNDAKLAEVNDRVSM